MTAATLAWGLHGRSSAELRAMYVDWYLRPVSRVLFADHPQIESVVLAFAQYWDDEADDAVHARVLTSPERDPVWDDLARREDGPLESPPPAVGAESMEAWRAREDAASDAWYEQHGREEARVEAACDEVTAGRWASFDNHDFVIAFAPFCVEGAHQDQDVVDAYRPYAVARRALEGEVAIDVVGIVHQPWREDEFMVRGNLSRFDDAAVERAPKPLSGAPMPVLHAATHVRERHQAARDLAGRMSVAFAARRRGEVVDTEVLERAVAEHEADLAALVRGPA